MIRENQIVHEIGDYWVLNDRGTFTVYRNGLTHSVADSSYADASLAIYRANYLAKRNP